MKPYFQYYFWIFVLTVMPSCSKPVDHDPVLAGQKAVEFVRAAFVRQDDENAYALLSDSTKRYVPLNKFKETLSRLRPGARPSKVTATEYEPMPGEKAVYVYIVVGGNPDQQSEYTVTMEGTASTDYRVSKITRGLSYIPSTTEKKKFSPPIS